MKNIFLLVLILISSISFGQECDYKITTPIYTGCFSTKHKNPSYIKYKLYKGGGDCDRKGMTFKHTEYTATSTDYAHNGYDKGHLANAEDFAGDCEKDIITFEFFNCIPQSPNLNRGIWKIDENRIRVFSQTDSLLIICGPGYTHNPKKIGDGLSIPDYCWKFVKSLSTEKILLCRYYTNLMKNNIYTDYNQFDLEKLIGFELK